MTGSNLCPFECCFKTQNRKTCAYFQYFASGCALKKHCSARETYDHVYELLVRSRHSIIRESHATSASGTTRISPNKLNRALSMTTGLLSFVSLQQVRSRIVNDTHCAWAFTFSPSTQRLAVSEFTLSTHRRHDGSYRDISQVEQHITIVQGAIWYNVFQRTESISVEKYASVMYAPSTTHKDGSPPEQCRWIVPVRLWMFI